MSKGITTMINELFGDGGKTEKAYKEALNKTIESLVINNNSLEIKFNDNSVISINDDGQCCCESRYMVCDDQLDNFIGDTFIGIDVKEAPDQTDELGDVHEVQFLEIKTNKGSFSIANHNEHNGYYGGFSIKVKELN